MTKKKPPVVLTPEEQKALEEGIRSEASGQEHTLKESVEFARTRRKAWLDQSHDLSA